MQSCPVGWLRACAASVCLAAETSTENVTPCVPERHWIHYTVYPRGAEKRCIVSQRGTGKRDTVCLREALGNVPARVSETHCKHYTVSQRSPGKRVSEKHWKPLHCVYQRSPGKRVPETHWKTLHCVSQKLQQPQHCMQSRFRAVHLHVLISPSFTRGCRGHSYD
eukprot:362192-Chlamydomonas_euryale.AAC.2